VNIINGLKTEVYLLNTSTKSLTKLIDILEQSQAAIDVGEKEKARKKMTDFISTVVEMSNLKEGSKGKLNLTESASLVCSGGNVLKGLTLDFYPKEPHYV
jgi:hypothetical protein